MTQQVPAFTAKTMTKDQFFTAYQHLAYTNEEHILLESGRDGNLSIAGINPLAKFQALEGDQLKITWRDGTEEIKEGDPWNCLRNSLLLIKWISFQSYLNFKVE